VFSLFQNNKDGQLAEILTEKGFERLYNAHWEKVFAVCYHNIHDLELAQEMSQDIFKSIWERRKTLVVKKSFEHYLVRAAKLKVAEHFRNQAIRKKHITIISNNCCHSTHCTEEDVGFSMLVEELELLVDRLPCQCRNVFHLSREKGMTNKEIAEELQVSERAVEYHISKALDFLKKNLPDYKL